jgi:hypothetical protein
MDYFLNLFIIYFFVKANCTNRSHKSVISSHQRLKLKMSEKRTIVIIHIYDVLFKLFSTNSIVNGGQ